MLYQLLSKQSASHCLSVGSSELVRYIGIDATMRVGVVALIFFAWLFEPWNTRGELDRRWARVPGTPGSARIQQKRFYNRQVISWVQRTIDS